MKRRPLICLSVACFVAAICTIAPGASAPAATPAQGSFIIGKSDAVWRISVDGKQRTKLFDGGWDTVKASPDGRSFLRVIHDRWTNQAIELFRPGKPLIHATQGAGTIDPVWTPDGRGFAYCSPETDYQGGLLCRRILRRRATDEKSEVIITPKGKVHDWGASFSPDGSKLAVQRWTPKSNKDWITVIDIATRKSERITLGSEPAWSPDGRTLAFTRKDGIYLVDLASRKVRRLARVKGAGELIWSADSQTLAYSTFTWLEGSSDAVWETSVKTGTTKRLFREAVLHDWSR